jgi:hypothetical protein
MRHHHGGQQQEDASLSTARKTNTNSNNNNQWRWHRGPMLIVDGTGKHKGPLSTERTSQGRDQRTIVVNNKKAKWHRFPYYLSQTEIMSQIMKNEPIDRRDPRQARPINPMSYISLRGWWD